MFRVHPIQLRRATEAPHIHFLTTTPDDPRAYIIASNIARRHMSKGQQAMAVAMVYPSADRPSWRAPSRRGWAWSARHLYPTSLFVHYFSDNLRRERQLEGIADKRRGSVGEARNSTSSV
jgi:hypothetical protein